MLDDLGKKNVNIDNIAKRALEDDKVLSELFEGILSKKDTIRYNSFKVFMLLSDEHPEVLYPKWDFFVELLSSDNTSHRNIAVNILANLTSADKENRFEKIFDQYYNLLDDESVIPAAQLAGNSGKIAQAKPKLQTKITKKLLGIDETHHEQQRKELIKSYAIKSLSEYFEQAENKKEIIEFVKKQLESKSPKTRKTAKEFLKKCDKSN
ncbi:MAG: hypothetical protein WED07_02440 [Candidatus Freyarchaeum deiterrae]